MTTLRFSLNKFSLSKFALTLLAFCLLLLGAIGGAGAQNPGGITTAPLEWLKADALTAADGAVVTAWTATSGVTPTGTATYHSVSGPNSKPYLTAATQGFTTTALTSAAGPYTAFAVVRIPDTSNHWLMDSQTGRFVLIPNDGGALGGSGAAYYDGTGHSAGTMAPVSTWQIVEWDLGSGTGSVLRNGGFLFSGSYADKAIGGTTGFLTAYNIGQQTGDCAEIVLFNSALTAADRTSVGGYLAAKYAIASSYSSVVIAPNDTGILYPTTSGGNWLISASAAKTINAGAYFRTFISGTATCKVGLSIGTTTPYSQCWARISGGAWQQYTPAAAGAQVWTLTMPTATSATKFLLEFVVKSTMLGGDRWNTQATAVQFTGLTLDPGASVSAPRRRKYLTYIYGDSITEGLLVNGTNTVDNNDALLSYALRLGELLDSETVVVGFGSTGMTTVAGGGSAYVPGLAISYNLLWSGQSRSFSPAPDLVIYNEGTNEAGATLAAMQTAFNTVIGGIGYTGTANTNAGLNGTRHLILRPFNGAQAANLPTIASSFSSANIVYGDTTGFWSTVDSVDALHPYGYAHLGNIAPAVASLALPLLRNASTTGGTKRRIQ